MSQITSLALRPKKFDELIGQKSITDAVIRQYASGREPPAWMFVGPTGSGKTSIARIMALSLQCTHQESFGAPCRDCRRSKTEFNIVEVNVSEFSGVEDIGHIVKGSNHVPLPPSRRRVYIMDEAHMLSKSSQNLLLKYFEDSPSSTVWIVCTTEPDKILRTLRGRCMIYPLKPLTIKGVELLIKRSAEKVKITMDLEPLIDKLHEQQIGSPRHILGALEKFAAGASAEVAVLEGEAAINTLAICKSVRAGDWESIKKEMSSADMNDARVARLAVAGYMKTILLTADGSKAAAAAEAIDLLAQASRTEDGVQVAFTLSKLYQITKRFQKL